MPVEHHESHEITKRASDAPYGCANRTMASGYWIKVRFYKQDGRYQMVDKYIQHRMSTECRYTAAMKDARCGGCRERETAPDYLKGMMERGAK